ncbi:small nuclear ribonucleoprotein [Suillus subalutaceus]|uniref:small nuclear ribonucleoprotein n=1 Tax=Suillus subalutaceus TaxID=48586 RepID=UPI001B86B0AA|nr:small nuclear ribonucleoprotein [Suillus subalutaceus]KAG1876608.1 small nuclear ribonucleoprotein [Suillus subalutaceus]
MPPPKSKGGKMLGLINWRLKVTINDGRALTGQMLAFDRHMNLVLADCEEFRRVRPKKKAGETEDTCGARDEAHIGACDFTRGDSCQLKCRGASTSCRRGQKECAARWPWSWNAGRPRNGNDASHGYAPVGRAPMPFAPPGMPGPPPGFRPPGFPPGAPFPPPGFGGPPPPGFQPPPQ